MVPAILVLADGNVFRGFSIGAEGFSSGELVFNTAMTAYQEVLTDASYANKLVTFTYPHIGNVGVNKEDFESHQVWAKGLIIRDLSQVPSSFRCEQNLSEFLIQQNIVGISDIDTRRLTRIIRDKGIQGATIYAGIDAEQQINSAREKANAVTNATSQDLVSQVSTQKLYTWTQGVWKLGQGFTQPENHDFHVVVYDLGVKFSVLRILASHRCKLTVVPANTSAHDVLALNPDGVFLSNGPGDASACTDIIQAVKILLDNNTPLFGLCLGHQVLALAAGATTKRLVSGHFGANHPVKNLTNNTVMITAQSHDFVVDETHLPDTIEVTHKALFDNTIQGIRIKHKPALSIQAYPEISAVLGDVAPLYSDFIALITAHRA